MDSRILLLDVNTLVQHLLREVQAVLGDHLIGMYLDGSLASGGFDQDSDIDFVVVTDEDISSEQFDALQAMHDRIARLSTPWAIQLEGSYLSQMAVRRYNPQSVPFPNIERGKGERLKWVHPHPAWVVHRHILYQHGITLTGPAPQTLVDPVTPQELRQAVLSLRGDWLEQFLEHPETVTQRGYQSYIVLTLCRMLFTLETGDLASKRAAALWAWSALDVRWSQLIERALEGRHHAEGPPEAEDMKLTLEMIRFVLDRCGKEDYRGDDNL